MSVKANLTAKPVRDSDEYAGMLRRMIRAFGRRVGEGDPDDLAELVALRGYLDDVITQAVKDQRSVSGYSWADVARGLGTSRQAAQERYGR